MTTATTRREAILPPTERHTVFGWLRAHLFSSWFNSLLTLTSLALLYAVLRPFLNWMLTTAEWAVIPANWNLLMRGQYPAEETWRLWMCLYLLGIVVGLGWGAWNRSIEISAVIVFAIPLLLLFALPFLSSQARLNLLILQACVGVAFVLARLGPPRAMSRLATMALLLYFPLVILLVRGLGREGAAVQLVPSNLWGGLLLSLLLAVVGIVFSFPLGVLLALGRQSRLPAIRTLSVIYIEFIRGVPLISLLFMAQVMLQLFMPAGFPPIDRVVRAMAAITLFSAAYTAENVRGGLQAIPRGQYEAAYALGLNGFQTTMRIVLPQALRLVIPMLVGQFIALFKDTSLVALVGLLDLLGIARTILANPNWLGTQKEVYLVVGLIYWIFCYAMSYASRRMETALGVGVR